MLILTVLTAMKYESFHGQVDNNEKATKKKKLNYK